MEYRTLQQLADHVGGRITGHPSRKIESVSTLQNAKAEQITFLTNKKYESQIAATNAGAVIVGREYDVDTPQLIADDPYYALQQIVVLLHGHRKHPPAGISKNANISSSAKLGTGCSVSNNVTISDDVRIGDNCYFYPGVFIGPGVEMGSDCILYPNAVVYDETQIGSRVIIQANASVGQDGYGFATHQDRHHKIPQIGRVILEDDVEIGACAAIERGTLDDTIIGTGSKVGDLVAIGHGTKIGPHCLLVPQVGISGSTTLGHHCVLAGQVGVTGHLKIGNMVQIGAQSGVHTNIPDGGKYLGSPAIDAKKTMRIWGMLPHIADMRKDIKRLKKQIEKLQHPE